MEKLPTHIRSQLLNHVLKYCNHKHCIDILCTSSGIINEAERQALKDGYAVEIEMAPYWAMYICADIGLPLTAKQVTAAAA